MNCVAHVEKASRRILRGHAGAFDDINIRLRAAVADWRFVRVHLHNDIVHAHGRKSREHVLDRVHAHGAFADGRGALDHFQILYLGVDCRFVLQILALEFDSVIDRRRMQLDRHLFACVQRRAIESGSFANGMLKLGGSGHER